MAAPARAFPLKATIQHFAPDPTDPDGVRRPVGETPTRCNLQPQWAREETANQDISQRSWNLYLPAGTTLGHQDRVIFAGLDPLEAIGEGRAFNDFAGRPHHVEAIVRKAE
jgi:hypothetical protein